MRLFARTSVSATRRCSLSVAFLTLLPVAGICLAQEQGEPAFGEVELTATVVGRDLAPRPVPEWRFKVHPVGHTNFRYLMTTGADGRASLALNPGEYEIRSESPFGFEQREFAWQVRFDVAEGDLLPLELSHENASIEDHASPGIPSELDEVQIYELARESIFKVSSESGHGSGFLVDSSGLVLTNHHLIASSDQPAVTVAAGRRYRAQVVAVDDRNDLAVLRINPIAVEALEPLALADDHPAASPCTLGQKVLAIGSPLASETVLISGLVSGIEEEAIYSDADTGPGNSGGPVFNMHGEVIGINTFGLDPRPGTRSTAGAGGFVRVRVALPLLESVQSDQRVANAPPAELLPLE